MMKIILALLVNKEIKIQYCIDRDFIIENNSNLIFMIEKIQITIKSAVHQKDELFILKLKEKYINLIKLKIVLLEEVIHI